MGAGERGGTHPARHSGAVEVSVLHCFSIHNPLGVGGSRRKCHQLAPLLVVASHCSLCCRRHADVVVAPHRDALRRSASEEEQRCEMHHGDYQCVSVAEHGLIRD